MSNHKSKKLLIEDDEPKRDESNPFSFKEFVRNKNHPSSSSEAPGTHGDTYRREQNSSKPSFSPGRFFDYPSVICQTSESWKHQPSACKEDDDFELCGTLDVSGYSYCSEEGNLTNWELAESILPDSHFSRSSTGSYDGDEETSAVDVSFHTKRDCSDNLGENLQKLREENSFLRKHVKELQKRSAVDTKRIKDLTDELHEKKVQEEQEAKALETMVQSVEHNLQLMTKRAVKAENGVLKFKQEIKQLQSQLEEYATENERLRCTETTTLIQMRHNAQVASEYLNKAAEDAESSIKQLLTGKETLCFVSQLLTSIDKISVIQD